MRRHGQYADTGANQMGSHMQHIPGQGQRLQQNPAMSNYMGHQDIVPGEEDRKYLAQKSEGRWQWEDDDASKGLSVMSPHQFKDAGQGSDASRYQGSRVDANFGYGLQGVSKESRDLPHEQEPRAAREDASLPRSLEGLEQKFLGEIMMLNKELQDAEDAELSRHRERIGEINTQYIEKLMVMRARQSNHRDDFLRQEMQARQQGYQHLAGNKFPGGDPHGYGQPQAAYSGGQVEAPYRERASMLQGAHGQGFEGKGSYPSSGGGQGYNSPRRGRFY